MAKSDYHAFIAKVLAASAEPIPFLMSRKFPDYLHQSKRPPPPETTISVGSNRLDNPRARYDENTRAMEQQREKLRLEYHAYINQLNALSPEELNTLYETEKDAYYHELRQEFAEKEKKRLFNQPHANADFSYWAKSTYWFLEEAIALSFGKNPQLVSWDKIKADLQVSPFVKQYSGVRDLALRAKGWKQLSDPVSPGVFLAWALRTKLEVPEALINEVKNHGVIIADWQSLYEKLKKDHEVMCGQLNAALSKPQEENYAPSSAKRVSKSDYWVSLENKANQAIENYPAWRSTQNKVQKSGNLHDWLIETIGADSREAEIIKKILSDIHKDLQ